MTNKRKIVLDLAKGATKKVLNTISDIQEKNKTLLHDRMFQQTNWLMPKACISFLYIVFEV